MVRLLRRTTERGPHIGRSWLDSGPWTPTWSRDGLRPGHAAGDDPAAAGAGANADELPDLAIGSRRLRAGRQAIPATADGARLLGGHQHRSPRCCWAGACATTPAASWPPGAGVRRAVRLGERRTRRADPCKGITASTASTCWRGAQRLGYRVEEVPYACGARLSGESKTGANVRDYLRRGWKYVVTVVKLARS